MTTQVKPGYKLTEAGVIPEDWELSELSAVCMTSSGTTPARSLADRYYRNGTTNWVKTLDLNNSEIADTDELVTQAALEETCLRVYPEGTVLVAMYGGFNQIGRTGLLRAPAAVNQAITAVQTKSTLHPEYLLATLNYRVDHWRSVASSSRKDPNITSQDVRSFKISFPPIKEQRAIAAALSNMDDLISGLDQLIAKKRDIQQAAMQQLLTGQQRLPGFSGEWEVKRLGDVAELKQGYTFKSSTYTSIGEFNIVTIANVQNGYMDISGCNKIDFLPRDIQPHQKLTINDILISMTGNVGRICRVEEPGCLLNQRVGKLSATSIDDKFFFYQISIPGFIAAMMGKAKGGAQANLSTPDITEYLIQVPKSKEEQIAIATILSDMDSELAILEMRCDKARQLKLGMMQELLTGRIRLSQSSLEAKLC